MVHIINRQTIELQLPMQADAVALQQEASNWFWTQAAGALERLFDRLVPEDRVVRLDKLEIDLGRVSEGELFSPAFLGLLEKKLEEAIVQELQAFGGMPSLRSRQSNFEAWQQFLGTGRLPWYVKERSTGTFGEPLPPVASMEWEAVEAQLEAVVKALAKRLSNQGWTADEVVQFLQRRLADTIQVPESTWRAWVERALVLEEKPIGNKVLLLPIELDEEVSGAIAQVKRFAQQWSLGTGHWLAFLETGQFPQDLQLPENILKSSLDSLALDQFAMEQLRRLFRRNGQALRRLALQHRGSFLKKVVVLFTSLPQDGLVQGLEELRAFYKNRPPRGFSNFRQLEVAIWELVLQRTIMEHQKTEGGQLLREVVQAPHLATAVLSMVEAAKRNRQKYPVMSDAVASKLKAAQVVAQAQKPIEKLLKSMDSEVKEGIYMANAGVVLLHVYLSNLFGELGLLTPQRQFKEVDGQVKAVHLLHYLATKEMEAPESELLLSKLLCGMDLEQPIDRFVALTEEERDECEGLLKAAIQHWGALGNASPDGLREGFLSRSGKLEKRESGWHLRVERQAIDILLDKLPWGIGMVKLPWMPSLLTVEWS
ncbi:MAG: hypothetical protein IPN76_17840 [Saprospiraceae bacterium]|nr:hypothetical protein [Saprospiraceae bacterium]